MQRRGGFFYRFFKGFIFVDKLVCFNDFCLIFFFWLKAVLWKFNFIVFLLFQKGFGRFAHFGIYKAIFGFFYGL